MLKPLHVFIGFCLLVFGGLYYYATEQDDKHSAQARLYLENALSEISSWQPEALRHHLTPAAREAVSNEQLYQVLEQYRPLGKFKSLHSLQFSTLTAALSVFGEEKRLSYSFPARFENGEALVTATLAVHEGQFRLYNFSIRRSES